MIEILVNGLRTGGVAPPGQVCAVGPHEFERAVPLRHFTVLVRLRPQPRRRRGRGRGRGEVCVVTEISHSHLTSCAVSFMGGNPPPLKWNFYPINGRDSQKHSTIYGIIYGGGKGRRTFAASTRREASLAPSFFQYSCSSSFFSNSHPLL